MASDSAATFGTGSGLHTIGQQPSRKVHVINGRVLCATSGSVGLSQSIINAITTVYLSKSPEHELKEAVQAKDLLSAVIRGTLEPTHVAAQRALAAGLPRALADNVGCATIVAIPVLGEARLYQFDVSGMGEAATDTTPFVTIGSGQPIADPFLAHLRRVFWPNQLPTVSEGTFAAVWTVQHVIQTNPGGVGGDVQVATISKEKKGKFVARLHAPEDIDEHKQNVQGAEEHLRRFALHADAAPAVPDPPKSD